MKSRDEILNLWIQETGKTMIPVPVLCCPSTQYYQARIETYKFNGED